MASSTSSPGTPSRATSAPWAPWARAEWLQLLVLALVIALPRLFALDADPPGDLHLHFITDEGWWAHNARQHALFGRWIMDEHNPPLYSTPLYTLLLSWVYALLGVGFYATRLLSGLSGIATCAIVYAFIRREVSRDAAFASALVLGCGYFFLTNNRAGFVESLQLAFATLAILAAIRSREAPRWGAVSALSLVASLLSKPSAIPVGAVIAAIYAVQLLERGVTPEARRMRWQAALAFTLTFVVASAGIAVSLVLPHWDGVRTEFASNVKIAVAPTNRLGGLGRLLWFGFRDEVGLNRLIMSGFFAQEPMLVISIASIGIARLMRRDPRPSPALEQGCWVWALVMLGSIAAQSYQPDRRYLLLVPPLAMLLGIAGARGIAPADTEPGPRVAWWRWMLAAAVGGFTIGLYARTLALAPLRAATAGWKIGSEAGFGQATLLVMIWGLSFLVSLALVLLWRAKMPRTRVAPALGLLAAVIVLDVWHAAPLAGHLTYTLRDASRDIGRVAAALPAERRAVVGNTSDTMCLENGVFAFLIRVWPEVDMYMNRDGIERFHPGLAVMTERRSRLAGGVESFSLDTMTPVRVYECWPDELGLPRLHTILYASNDIAGRVPPATPAPR